MKIVTLMENTAASEGIISSHGLSLYIETKNHKILFDMGPDGDFVKNAKTLGIDLAKVDIAILSHGHYDHGGGLEGFLEVNQKAKIHIQKKALGEFYSHDPDGSQRYIGLSPLWKDNPRVEVHTGDYKLDAELQIFAGVTGRECYSPANDCLFASMNGRHIQDLFMHEQNLLIREGDKIVLFAGCAHNGIVNILKKAESFVPAGVDYVIGGMHLRKAFETEAELETFCGKLSGCLLERQSRYYTCHCTGVEAYEALHRKMGDRIGYLSAGSILTI